MHLHELKQLIRAGELDAVRAAIDANPDLVQTSDPDPDAWDEKTALHCAPDRAARHRQAARGARGGSLLESDEQLSAGICRGVATAIFGTGRMRSMWWTTFSTRFREKADGTNKLGATINIAAREGWTEIVRRHIELDPLSVFQRGWIGDSPLHWPSHNGHAEIVTMLLDAGADIEADEINCYGGKPLHWASEHEPHIVKLLLERGANVNSVNRRAESEFFGITPLMMNALMTDDCAGGDAAAAGRGGGYDGDLPRQVARGGCRGEGERPRSWRCCAGRVGDALEAIRLPWGVRPLGQARAEKPESLEPDVSWLGLGVAQPVVEVGRGEAGFAEGGEALVVDGCAEVAGGGIGDDLRGSRLAARSLRTRSSMRIGSGPAMSIVALSGAATATSASTAATSSETIGCIRADDSGRFGRRLPPGRCCRRTRRTGWRGRSCRECRTP